MRTIRSAKALRDARSAKMILAGIESRQRARERNHARAASGSEFTILEGAHRCRAQLPVPGLHMVQNAIARRRRRPRLRRFAGRMRGRSRLDSAHESASANQARSAAIQFIDDSYNANPESMKAALRTLVELDADGQRIAVLGQMGELGSGIGARPSRSRRSGGRRSASII